MFIEVWNEQMRLKDGEHKALPEKFHSNRLYYTVRESSVGQTPAEIHLLNLTEKKRKTD